LARLNLTRPRTLGIMLAVVSLSFAACSKSGSSPTPSPSATASAIVAPSNVPTVLISPCSATKGIAYEPDGGNGGAFTGVQVTHFEDDAGNLCGATSAPAATPPGVAFSSAVGGIAFAVDTSVAVALLQNGSGGYTLAQDVFGANVGSIVPVGMPYDVSKNPPTPAPNGSASPSATASPSNAPLIADGQSIAILGGGSSAVALTAGLAASGSSNALVALTSLTNAPPQYGGAVPFSGSSYTLKSIPNVPRSIVRINLGNDSSGLLRITALARGPQDLVAFNVATVGTGYQFDAQADDTTLGSSATLRGNGAIAFSPTDGSRALVGGTTGGANSQLTLVTGLPSKITSASTLTLPGNIRSVAIASGGAIGVIATDVGIVVVKGVDAGTLSIVPPFAPSASSALASAPTYRTCSGAQAALNDVRSVGFSIDARYLVALGSTAGVNCASGYNASLVALPFNPATGSPPSPAPTVVPSPGVSATPSPAPTMFVQNNVIAPPAGADYLYVR
jgi:hypothetical protein